MPSIVVITGSGDLARRVARVIAHAFPEALFLVEAPAAPWPLLRRRIRRHGVLTAFGQVAFRWLLARKLRRERDRNAAIWQAAGLPEAPHRPERTRRMADVNGPATLACLQEARPTLVILFAVSKLSPRTLSACGAPVLNLHPGITPAYRGVHSGYWALRNGDPGRFGATIHLVDEGLDTGAILDQVFCHPEPGDTVATHPGRLVAAGLPRLLHLAQEVVEGRLPASRPAGPMGRVYHEPTLWAYVVGGLRQGVW